MTRYHVPPSFDGCVPIGVWRWFPPSRETLPPPPRIQIRDASWGAPRENPHPSNVSNVPSARFFARPKIITARSCRLITAPCRRWAACVRLAGTWEHVTRSSGGVCLRGMEREEVVHGGLCRRGQRGGIRENLNHGMVNKYKKANHVTQDMIQLVV